MNKRLLIPVLAATAALAISPAASATITSPAVGGPFAAAGTLTLRMNIIGTTCNVAASSTVVTTSLAAVRSATFSGCGQGIAITAAGLPWQLAFTLSPRTFALQGVTLDFAIPIYGRCVYSGGLTGTYTAPGTAVLTITGDTLAKVAGSALCSADPIFTGTLRTTATVA